MGGYIDLFNRGVNQNPLWAPSQLVGQDIFRWLIGVIFHQGQKRFKIGILWVRLPSSFRITSCLIRTLGKNEPWVKHKSLFFDAKLVQVLNETTKQMTVTMGNPNPLPVNYQWSFVEDAASWLDVVGWLLMDVALYAVL